MSEKRAQATPHHSLIPRDVELRDWALHFKCKSHHFFECKLIREIACDYSTSFYSCDKEQWASNTKPGSRDWNGHLRG